MVYLRNYNPKKGSSIKNRNQTLATKSSKDAKKDRILKVRFLGALGASPEGAYFRWWQLSICLGYRTVYPRGIIAMCLPCFQKPAFNLQLTKGKIRDMVVRY